MSSIRLVALFAIFASLFSIAANALPFNNGELFTGRSIKQDPKDKAFSFGANFQIAPVKAIIQSQVKKKINDEAAKDPAMKVVVDNLKNVDTKQMKQYADSTKPEDLAKLKDMLATQMKAQNGGQPLTADQQKGLDAITPANVKNVATLIEIYNEPPQNTITFSLEPYVSMNTSPVQVTASIAIAGFHTDAGNSVELGNAGLDLKVGDRYGESGMAFGWSAGVNGWAPTGTSDADTIALANPLALPKYSHNYASVQGYGMLAAELGIVDITLRGEYTDMFPAKGKGDQLQLDPARRTYVVAGASVLANLGLVGVSLEGDGVVMQNNATMLKNLVLLTAGVRGYLGNFLVGGAVQMPVTKDTTPSTVQDGGADSLAAINFLVNAQLKF